MNEGIDVRNYNELSQSIALAQHIVYKRYLPELEKYPIVKPSQVILDEETENCVRMIRLTELSCKKDEDIFQKLTTVYHASMSLGCNLVVMVDVESVNAPAKIYVGVRNKGENQEDKTQLATSFYTLKNGIKSNFPGTKFENVESPKLVDEIFGDNAKYISTVSCVAAVRDKIKTENKTFVQGIERLIDAMQGNTYTAVFIAEPISQQNQSMIREGYENIYSSLAPFAKSTWSYNESQSDAVMKSVSEGLSKAITIGSSHTQSHTTNVGINIGMNGTRSNAVSNGHTESYGNTSPTKVARTGQAVSAVAGVVGLIGKLMAPICPVGAMISGVAAGVASVVGGTMMGGTDNHTTSESITNTEGRALGVGGGLNAGYARTSADTTTNSETNTRTQTNTNGTTNTESSGRTLQIENVSKPIEQMLDRIDELLKRTRECEDYGAYNCAVYFVSGKQDSCMLGANTFRALMIGEGSSIESGAINFWNGVTEPEKVNVLKEYIKRFVHPVFARPISEKMDSEDDFMKYTAGTIVSGLELPLHIGFPTKSVYGLPVIEHAEFGKEVTKSKVENDVRELELGSILCMGDELNTKAKIDIESLSMHTFITGSTGKGKSTVIYSILDKLMDLNIKGKKEKIKFMVIEPAKGEYKDRFGNYENVNVYGTNVQKTPLLRIDPFSFPDDIHVLEHIDRLVEIFNVCWPMYAAMPAVLKDAVERAYVVSGWNLQTSECRYVRSDGEKIFPSFADVLKQIGIVMDDSMYSSDSKGDYKGALCTRIKSLTNGLYGEIFTNDELLPEQLFDSNVIVDLSRIGSSETKALIMGLLVMKLQEYRMSSAQEMNSALKHVTVLEEAHNILKKTSTEQSNDSANMIGKSVELLANSIAEMRTYGEGFIIADQAPGLMDLSVIRNTNTKIILGLPDYEDRRLVGKAAGLNDNQIEEIARLQTFSAVVYQNNWLESILCKIEPDFKKSSRYVYKPIENLKYKIDPYIEFLLTPLNERKLLDSGDVEQLVNEVYKLPISSETKIAFIEYAKTSDKQKAQKLRGQAAYGIFNSEEALRLAKNRENNIEIWYNYVKEILDPAITLFTEADQQKIVALITKEKAELDGRDDAVDLFEKLMNFI